MHTLNFRRIYPLKKVFIYFNVCSDQPIDVAVTVGLLNGSIMVLEFFLVAIFSPSRRPWQQAEETSAVMCV